MFRGSDAVESLLQLKIVGPDGVQPFPLWASYLVRLGAFVSKAMRHGRVTLAVSLPTRDFAAMFVSLGVVLERATTPLENVEYFSQLLALPLGTPVRVTRVGKRLKGAIDGVIEVHGKRMLLVRISNSKGGNLTVSVDAPSSHSVEIDAGRQSTNLKLPANQKGREILNSGSPLVSHLLGKEAAAAFESRSRLEVETIAIPSRFEGEVSVIRLLLRSGSERPLSECLRLLTDDRAQEPYRSRLTSFRRKATNSGRLPNTAVFDGANAYLGRARDFKASNRVILLDRTETLFGEAANHFNQEYLKRSDAMIVPGPPGSGMEISGFVSSQP